MEVKSHLAHTIDSAGARAKYDANVKQILADKQVLAKILKNVTKEFECFDETTIINCIEGEPEIGTHNVYPGKSEAVHSMNTESRIPSEGEVTFDIRFYAITPTRERVKLILNVEAQKKYHVGYDFAARGIFYCSRMISEQLDKEFSTEDYNGLKKVYSIWICMQSPERYANTISKYSIEHQSVYGDFTGREKYDLLSVVIVRLSQTENSLIGNTFHQFLTLLLSERIDVETKKKRLVEEHHVKMTKELEGGIIGMCNLSELVEERGIEKGMQQGIEQGLAEGLVKAIDNIIESFHVPLARACESQKITLEDYYAARRLLGLE